MAIDYADFDAIVMSERDNTAVQAALSDMRAGKGKDLRLVGDYMVARFGDEAAVFRVRHLFSVKLNAGGE